MSKRITVTAKISAGHHPVFGEIVAGRTYEIEAGQFADQLFHPIETAASGAADQKTAPPAPTGKKAR